MELLTELLTTFGPAISAVLAIVIACLSATSEVKKALTELRNKSLQEVVMKKYEETVEQMKAVLTQNEELMKQNAELKELITHVRRK